MGNTWGVILCLYSYVLTKQLQILIASILASTESLQPTEMIMTEINGEKWTSTTSSATELEGSFVEITTSLDPVLATVTVPNVVSTSLNAAETYLSVVALITVGSVNQQILLRGVFMNSGNMLCRVYLYALRLQDSPFKVSLYQSLFTAILFVASQF